jgi:hypothetical protein
VPDAEIIGEIEEVPLVILEERRLNLRAKQFQYICEVSDGLAPIFDAGATSPESSDGACDPREGRPVRSRRRSVEEVRQPRGRNTHDLALLTERKARTIALQ